MTRRLMFGLCAAIALVCAPNPFAQERERLADVMTDLRARQQAGAIRLVKR